MIYMYSGEKVKIISGDKVTSEALVEIEGQNGLSYVNIELELRADGGLEEIYRCIDEGVQHIHLYKWTFPGALSREKIPPSHPLASRPITNPFRDIGTSYKSFVNDFIRKDPEGCQGAACDLEDR